MKKLLSIALLTVLAIPALEINAAKTKKNGALTTKAKTVKKRVNGNNKKLNIKVLNAKVKKIEKQLKQILQEHQLILQQLNVDTQVAQPITAQPEAPRVSKAIISEPIQARTVYRNGALGYPVRNAAGLATDAIGAAAYTAEGAIDAAATTAVGATEAAADIATAPLRVL